MTQEEKAKAYDEALTIAKRIISKNCSEVEKLCLKSIFPELAESEDEKVRKEIIEVLQFVPSSMWEQAKTDYERCFAYLEKQKNLDKMIVVSPEVWDKAINDAYENGKKDGEKQKEQKPAWSEEDEIMIGSLINYFEGDALDCSLDCVVNWLKSISMRCPKSSDNWKPSEEQMKALCNAIAITGTCSSLDAVNTSLELESLREQLKKLM